jgi:cytochrome c oxidase subunit II
MAEPRHLRRILIMWIGLSVVATPIVVLLWDPALPPGTQAGDAQGVVTDNTVLMGVATPIAAGLLVYFAYVLTVFRQRGPGPAEGVAIHGNRRVMITWLAVTSTVAVSLAVFGTVRLLADGAGGGQGPDPLSTPSGGKPLQVQVIGQQWNFTYRFPSYGGVETLHLQIPVKRDVEFHVTSLDVVHSFWAHQLGVKVDANPGEDNVAFVNANKTGVFDIRCAELCGLWHGYMFDTGRVVSESSFLTWIRGQQRKLGPATRSLPPYSPRYFPAPDGRAG